MSVTLGIAAVQKSAEDTLTGAEDALIGPFQSQIRASYLTCVKKAIRKILDGFGLLHINSYDNSFSVVRLHALLSGE